MNRKLARDLHAWEAGRLSVADLIRRHPSDAEQVDRLTGLFTEIRSLADGPVPDATRGWNQVRSRMAAHVSRHPVSLADRLSPRLHRRVALGLTAALLVVPPVALAAANEAVRDEVTDFVLGGIDDLSVSIFGGSSDPASGQDGGESSLPLDVNDPTTPAVPLGPTNTIPSTSTVPEVEEGPGPLSGKDGGNVVTSGSTSGSNSGTAANGLAGADGGNGDAGKDGSGKDGESNDGNDAKSADVKPSPTPTPADGTSDSGDSASSPSVNVP